MPRHYIRLPKKKRTPIERLWARTLSTYMHAPAGTLPSEVAFRSTTTRGIGIFLTKTMPKDSVLHISGHYGRQVPKRVMESRQSVVTRSDISGFPRSYALFGPISYINAACLLHANCISHQVVEDDEPHSDWKLVTLKSKVKKNDELLLFYGSEFSDLPCPVCK